MKEINASKPIVIIGAGTIGLMLAHELVLRGKRIIIIEAGNETFDFFNNSEYKSIGKIHAGVQYGRVKGVGGTSNLWGGQLTEFISNDIENNIAYQQPEWPIEWNVIQKYYEKVYEKLGFTSQVPFNPQTLIQDENSENSLEIFCSRWIKNPNFKFQYWEFLQNSELVTISTNSVVVGLEFENTRCNNILYSKNGEIIELKDFEDIILANGTIEIIRLLLHCASTKKAIPFANNKNIGTYFQDHLNFKVGEIENPSKYFLSKFSNFFENSEKLQPKLRLNPKNYKKSNYLGVCGFFSYESNMSEHIHMFKQFAKSLLGQSKQKLRFAELCRMFFKLIPASPQIMMLVFNYLKNNKIYVPFNSKVKVIINTQQISIVQSKVTISKNEFDKFGLPKVLVDWQIDGREIEGITEFCNLLYAYLEKNKLGNFKLDDWFLKTNHEKSNDWLTEISDVYHQAGGTIMSNSKDEGVVDENLKVFGTDNLFICGSAVMPTSSYGNITLTALALGLRLADHLTYTDK